MSFATLPHKLAQPDEFDKGVADLRKRFSQPTSTNFIFKPAYHKRIPADGIAPYMQGIWEQILANKDLDLPTQQELLAQFRCDEIASVAFADFEKDVSSFRQPVSAGSLVSALGSGMTTARDSALSTSGLSSDT